ncbi:hypothetical protein HDV00_005885 [Rhizophlyctis rosea]|nr:hypothetical protein HDV00_005885 [Rhizophlyctis rosea]
MPHNKLFRQSPLVKRRFGFVVTLATATLMAVSLMVAGLIYTSAPAPSPTSTTTQTPTATITTAGGSAVATETLAMNAVASWDEGEVVTTSRGGGGWGQEDMTETESATAVEGSGVVYIRGGDETVGTDGIAASVVTGGLHHVVVGTGLAAFGGNLALESWTIENADSAVTAVSGAVETAGFGGDEEEEDSDKLPTIPNIATKPKEAFSPTLTTNEEEERGGLFALSDLHGDIVALRTLLKLSGLVDNNLKWAGKKSVLVIFGPFVKELYTYIRILMAQAAAEGGHVEFVLGNHEAMNLAERYRYVKTRDLESFGGEEARKKRLAKGGDVGEFLRGLNVLYYHSDNLFVHGGIHPRTIKGLPLTLNLAIKNRLRTSTPAELYADRFISKDTSPLWYRGLAQKPEVEACPEAEAIKEAAKVKRIIIGHTTTDGEIVVRCGGTVVLFDTGNSLWSRNPPRRNILRIGPDGHAHAISETLCSVLW